jgi:acyl dehydratase
MLDQGTLESCFRLEFGVMFKLRMQFINDMGMQLGLLNTRWGNFLPPSNDLTTWFTVTSLPRVTARENCLRSVCAV